MEPNICFIVSVGRQMRRVPMAAVVPLSTDTDSSGIFIMPHASPLLPVT